MQLRSADSTKPHTDVIQKCSGRSQRKMVEEKTPKLFLSKSPFEYEEKREKVCSRFTLSWILSALLIALVILAFLEFSYPPSDGKVRTDDDCIIKVYQDQPSAIPQVKPPVITDYVPEKSRKDSEERGKSVKKDSVVDQWSLDFVTDPKHLCATHNPPNSEQYHLDPEVKLLILIPSATSHFLQRKAIRNTWGSIAEKPFGPIRLGFVLGITFNKTEDGLILQEISKYKDIIQVSYADAYSQPTEKNILMLKWMAERCPHAEYFIKAEDDTFINIGTIANILGNEPFVSEEKFIGGFVQRGAQPSKIPEKKYDELADYLDNKLPPYVSGSAFVTNGPTAVELFQASKELQPLLPEVDVFVTGFCGDYIDATLIHEPRFTNNDPPNPPTWQSLSNLATAHSISPNIMELIWKEINESLSAMDLLLNQEAAINATVLLGKKRKFLI